jgi:hypothetical protein
MRRPKGLVRRFASVDAQGHIFIVNRNDMTDKEGEIAQQAPPSLNSIPTAM